MNRDRKYWFLRNHQMFSHMSNEQIQSLCVISNFKTAVKNEIIDLTDLEKRIYSLKKGTIKIIGLDEAGNEVTKDVLQKGDIFGEITLSDNPRRQANEYARAASPEVSVCSFKVADFEQALRHDPTLAIRYTKQVGDKLKAMENRFSNLVFKDVRTRLMDFLKDFALQNGTQEMQSVTTRHFLTQQDIACLIGSSRQTVTTLMNELTKNNLLEYSRSTFTIPNLAAFK